MDSMPFNVTDIVVVAIVLISAGLAFARGFIHEALAISGWIIAYFGAKNLAFYVEPLVKGLLDAFPTTKEFVETHFSLSMVVTLGALVITFALILALCAIVTHLIARAIRGSAINAVDRSLGFAFGIARGALLVSLAYLLATWIWVEDMPPWLAEAKTRQLMANGAEFLQELAPEGLNLDKKEPEERPLESSDRAPSEPENSDSSTP